MRSTFKELEGHRGLRGIITDKWSATVSICIYRMLKSFTQSSCRICKYPSSLANVFHGTRFVLGDSDYLASYLGSRVFRRGPHSPRKHIGPPFKSSSSLPSSSGSAPRDSLKVTMSRVSISRQAAALCLCRHSSAPVEYVRTKSSHVVALFSRSSKSR